MKAAANDQERLLEVSALDTQLVQLQHKAKNLPERADLAEVMSKLPIASDAAALLGAQVADLELEVARIESEIEQVRNRVTKDRDLLEGGTVTAQVLENLQHELETLARRQGELEESELEVLEQVETLSGQREAARAIEADLITEHERITAAIDAAVADINADKEGVVAQRTAIVASLPTDLVALYDKISADLGAPGAAALQYRRCMGCQIELVATDINHIREAADDEVIRCEECRRILVRTAESGL